MRHCLYKAPVLFDAESHTYTLGEKRLGGITPIVAWVFPDTYRDIPQSVLDAAAERGHKVHAACQMADNLGFVPDDAPEEVSAYSRLCRLNKLTSIRNEYLVSDEQAVASSVDVVMREDGCKTREFALADIKTTSTLHRANVLLQLSLYAYLFEKQNEWAEVRSLYALWLPKPQYGEPQLVKLSPRIPAADCEAIIKAYLAADREALTGIKALEELMPAAPQQSAQLPAEVMDAEREIIQLEATLREAKAKRDELQAGLLTLMKQHGVKKYETERMLITYVAPTRRKTFDAKRLQSEKPDLYTAFLTESETRESIRIKVR